MIAQVARSIAQASDEIQENGELLLLADTESLSWWLNKLQLTLCKRNGSDSKFRTYNLGDAMCSQNSKSIG